MNRTVAQPQRRRRQLGWASRRRSIMASKHAAALQEVPVVLTLTPCACVYLCACVRLMSPHNFLNYRRILRGSDCNISNYRWQITAREIAKNLMTSSFSSADYKTRYLLCIISHNIQHQIKHPAQTLQEIEGREQAEQQEQEEQEEQATSDSWRVATFRICCIKMCLQFASCRSCCISKYEGKFFYDGDIEAGLQHMQICARDVRKLNEQIDDRWRDK